MVRLRATVGASSYVLFVCIESVFTEYRLSTYHSVSSDDSPADDLLWYPRDKIAIAERKMCGGNPAYITRDEVRRSAVLSGDILKMAQKACIGDEECYRSQQSEDNLSVETQVDCLIDQATDGNLLGRMFFGWEPWV